MKFLKWVAIVIVALFILAAIFGKGEKATATAVDASTSSDVPAVVDSAKPTEVVASVSTSAPAPVVIQVTAKELAQQYEDNEAAGDAKYKNKLLEVTGVITSITKDLFDDTQIHLKGIHSFFDVYATLESSEEAKAIELKKQQPITLHCIGDGEVIGVPLLKNCMIQ